ncbi:MAG TPA: general secretion pathway protein GspB [Steroidobacteraceae bacterium]
MSFILDALKKSEIERQRQSMPGLMDTPSARRRGGLPLWALLLGVLLVINVAVLAVVLTRNSAPVIAAPRKHTDAPSVAQQATPLAADHFSPLDAPPVYAPEIPVTAADGAPAGSGAVASGPAPPLGAPRTLSQRSAPRSAVHRPEPVLIDEDAQADNTEVLPSINDLNLSGTEALPELHLDVHVYATKPAERFVYINMRKYHEGSALPEGPVIERIRRDGVVLSYRGLRFILPRQS